MVIDGVKILEEILFIKETILERALLYSAISDINLDELYDIGMDRGVVINYDQNDRENHSFDMGRLYTLENLIINK